MRAVKDGGCVDGGWKGNDRSINPSIGISKGGEGIDRSGGEHSPSPQHDARVMRVMVILLPPQSGGHRDHCRSRQATAMVRGLGEDYGRREAARRRRRRTTTMMMTMGATLAARGQNGDVPAAADAAAAVAAAGDVAASIDDAAIVAAAAVVAAGPRMRTLGGAYVGGCLSMTDPPSGYERCTFLEREYNITTLCCFVFFLSNNKSVLVTSCDSQKKP
jgi:hypothetical protein